MLKEQKLYHSRPHVTKSTRSDGFVEYEAKGVDTLITRDFRDGTELPFHKQMIQNRVGATSNLTAGRESVEFNTGSSSVSEWSGTYKVRTHFENRGSFTLAELAPKTVTASAVAEARATSLGRYYSHIQEQQKSVQGQVMAGEIRETIQLLRRPFKQGIALLRSMMSNGSTFRSMVRRSGDLWLQYRFGILPLISDCEGIKKMLLKQAQREHVGSERVYGRSQASQTLAWQGAIATGGASLYGTKTYTQTAELIIRFGYLHKAQGALAAVGDDFMESFLNPRDLPSTAWELIPFSFLIDYFVNIGSMIQSATTYTGAIVWTSQSLVTTSDCTLNISYAKSNSPNTYKVDAFTPSYAKRTVRLVDRTAAPPGIPPMVFELPGSDIRLANIAALLAGLLKGK